jgi:hypothetical protein
MMRTVHKKAVLIKIMGSIFSRDGTSSTGRAGEVSSSASPKMEASDAVVTRHVNVSGMELSQETGGQTTPKDNSDNSASPADVGRCDVGLGGTLLNSACVLSPIDKKHQYPYVKFNSSRVKHEQIRHCHTFASKKGNSSKRTRAAAGAFFKWSGAQLIRRDRVRNRVRYLWKKRVKQQSKLLYVEETKDLEGIQKKFTASFLKNNVVVFDGGDIGEEELKNQGGKRWKCEKICTGGLEICSPPNASTGVAYQKESDLEPRFVLIPREESLKINSDGNSLCDAMIGIMKAQKNLKRGRSKQVFSDSKYCCVGSKPRRSAPGVEPGKYKLEDGGAREDWDEVLKSIKRGEHAFHGYLGTDVIRQIREARNLVGWERPQTASGQEGKGPSIFNAVAFGVNVFLRAHMDQDFTYSVIQAHVREKYDVNDAVVCYFCFPGLGVAVPLRPGDFLLINALEYHCVSSRCNSEMDVFVLSCYLKTAVVGGNDNKRRLNDREEEGLRKYDEVLQESKRARSM